MVMFSQITTVPAVHMRVMPIVAAVIIILAITSVVATLHACMVHTYVRDVAHTVSGAQ
jgi:hypothetical protein